MFVASVTICALTTRSTNNRFASLLVVAAGSGNTVSSEEVFAATSKRLPCSTRSGTLSAVARSELWYAWCSVVECEAHRLVQCQISVSDRFERGWSWFWLADKFSSITRGCLYRLLGGPTGILVGWVQGHAKCTGRRSSLTAAHLTCLSMLLFVYCPSLSVVVSCLTVISGLPTDKPTHEHRPSSMGWSVPNDTPWRH